MSDLPDKPQTVEIRQVGTNLSLPKGYDLIDQKSIHGEKMPSALLLRGGLVAQFDVPAGWEKRRDLQRHFFACGLKSNGNVELRIGSRGLPVAPRDISHMKKLFDSKNLTLSGEDVAFLQKAIDYGSDMPIIVQSARVHDMRFERVVDFVGRYNFPDGKNRSLRCCLIDVDGTTRFLEPIAYEAPPNLFNKYMPQAEKIFNSMVTFSECPPFRNR